MNNTDNKVYSVEKENIFKRFFNRLFNRDKVSQLQNEVDKFKEDINMDRIDNYKTELNHRKENEKSINMELVNMTEDYFNHNFTEDEKINIYDDLHNTLDNEGWTMLNVIKKLIPCDLDSEFYTEDVMGVFAEANGNDLKKYYEIAAFSERQYEQIGAYERMSSYSDYSKNPEYLKYKDKLIDETIKEIINKHPVESMEVLKEFKNKQTISNNIKLENGKNDIKITVLDVENKNVEKYFKKGQVLTLQDANRKFMDIEMNPDYMIEQSKMLGIDHPYTKVGFKVELHDGNSINVRYSFGTKASESLVDFISDSENYGLYLSDKEKNFYNDFKNEALLVKIAENFKDYLWDLAYLGNRETKILSNIYDKFDKDFHIKDTFKESPNTTLDNYDDAMAEAITEVIAHKPLESIELIKDISNELKPEYTIKIEGAEGIAKDYFNENERMGILESNEKFKKIDMEIASVANGVDISLPKVELSVVAKNINEQIGMTYYMGSSQRKDLIELIENCKDYNESVGFLNKFYVDSQLIRAFEASKEISTDYLKNEYKLDELNKNCINNVIVNDNNNDCIYVDNVNKFGQLEAFTLINKNDAITSYELKKEDSGLSKDYSIDFSKRHLVNTNDAKSQIKALDNKNVIQKIDSVKKALDKANLIKETNVQSISQRQDLKNSIDLSM